MRLRLRGAPELRLKSVDAATIGRIFERVYARRGLRALGRIERTFGLSKSGLGRLFGISRQAVDEWLAKGVPASRIADVGRIADLAAALERRFIPERVPQIARAAIPGLGGRSILDAIAVDGPVPVLELLERAFSFIPGA